MSETDKVIITALHCETQVQSEGASVASATCQLKQEDAEAAISSPRRPDRS